MRDQDISKVMKYIKENLDEVKQIIAFLEEQDTAAGTDKQSDPDDNFSDEDTDDVMGKGDCGADEDCDDVMNEGEGEKAGTEETSDGVDYPDVGDDDALAAAGIKEEEESDDDTEEIEECGTPSVGAATGPAQGVQGTQGSANDGIARVKSRMGKTQKRYDESVGLLGTAEDVKAMMESWKSRPKYDPNQGGF